MNALHIDLGRYMDSLDAAMVSDLLRERETEFTYVELLSTPEQFSHVIQSICVRHEDELSEFIWKIASRSNTCEVAKEFQAFLLKFSQDFAERLAHARTMNTLID